MTGGTEVPLYVEMDGALLSIRTVTEAAILRGLRSPASAVQALRFAPGCGELPGWLVDRGIPDPRSVPYRASVLERVRNARRAGRRVVLVSEAPRTWVVAVSTHLGLFDDVITGAGDGGRARDRVLADAKSPGYDFVGSPHSDPALIARARHVSLVGGGRQANASMRRLRPDVEIITDGPSTWRAVLRSLRPHQWLKNCLIFVPAALAHAPVTPSLILALVAAFVSFSLVASAVYTINDLVDVEDDRRHRTKRDRPFASGALPVWLAPAQAILLLAAGLAVAAALVPGPFTSMLVGYFGINIAYSLWLKQKLIIDVVVLASLYTWRILAGGVAADVTVSEWLLAASMFGFTSLAFIKRYSNLIRTEDRATRRGYVRDDLETVAMLGSASGFMTVLVMALYVSSDRVRTLYAEPVLLWLVCPLLLYWFARVWLLARRGEVPDDPVVFVARDPVSLLTLALIGVVGYFAAVGI